MKTKVRFDGLDVAAMVAHWNRDALGRRVINIYDGPNGDTYLFKLDKKKPSSSSSSSLGEEGESSRETSNLLLVVESGLRFHSTVQPTENPGMPSQFCSKMRKHLRGLRLENVQQLGNKDRVVNLIFGSGESQRHSLILEFYARGNIILTNSQYQILSLLRSHEYDNVKVKVGHAYPVTYATTMSAVTENNKDSDSDNNGQNDKETGNNETFLDSTNPMEWFQKYQEQKEKEQPKVEQQQTKGKKKKKGGGDNSNNALRTLLLNPISGVSHYGPSLIDHCILSCATASGTTTTGDDDDNNNNNTSSIGSKQPNELNQQEWFRIQDALKSEGAEILNKLDGGDTKGYIFYKLKEETNKQQQQQGQEEKEKSPTVPPSPFDGKIILEFQPHVLKQHESMLRMEYKSFDRAVDAFFSHIEGQKRMLRAETQQAQAQQRLDKIRTDQQQRVENLERQQELLKEQAQLVELHADMVEKAIQVVNSALDSGMDWDQLEDLVQIEKYQNQNPVAMLIHKLDLEQDAMVLRLAKEDAMYDGGDSENEEEGRSVDITVTLKDTAHGNASALFARYRASKEKSKKTIEASAKALEAAEESAQRQLLEAQKRKKNLSSNLNVKRKPLWFEKFNWFVTSDNYLVLAGRDAQQNEQIVKRYLRPGDAYLHADVHGAASCVLRAKRKRRTDGKTFALPLSDQALREAGNFTICRSSAWSSRMVTSAWWVESHQVSKTAPTGEYLTVGSFMIRGKKNFLPPTQLEMGLGVLFRLGDDEAITRHKNERRDFALMQMEEGDDSLDAFVPVPEKSVVVPKKHLDSVEEEDAAVHPQKLSKEEDTKEESKAVSNSHLGNDEGKKLEDTEAVESSPELVEENEENANTSYEKGNGVTAEENTAKETSPQKAKKGLSVKERKLIRKYGSLEAARAAEEERQQAEEERRKSQASIPPKPKNIGNQGQMTKKRGKKGKMKRAARKYADQDEEDRELAMLALHAGEKSKTSDRKKAPEISETEKEAAAQTIAILKKDSSVVAEKLPDQVRELLAKCVTVKNSDSDGDSAVRWDKFDADVLEQLDSFDLLEEKVAAANRLLTLKESTRIDNFSASLAGIIRTIKKYGHQGLGDNADTAEDSKRKTKAEKDAEKNSWKQTLAEEGIVEDGEEEDALDDTIELSKLTGQPHQDDLLLFAVPVCAPYQTLSKYGYRVKLTPGNMKRGKASKQCIEMFLKDGQKTALADRYKDMIRRIPDPEWVSAICGDVKISAAGASKVMKNQKSKNKAKNKK